MSDETFQRLLLEAMGTANCPACTVIEAMVFDELCQLQRQAVVDPETQADVLARGGYCADHFWYLNELASPVTNAALLAPLMDRVSEHVADVGREISASGRLLRQGAAAVAARLGAPHACCVCERAALWEKTAIEVILGIVADLSRREQYNRSTGLCLPHLAQALSECSDRALAAALVHASDEQVRRLGAQLRTYARKYEQRDRRWGPEDAAPRAAVEKLVGGKRRGR